MLMAALALSPGIKMLMNTYGVDNAAATLTITLPYLVSIPFTVLTGRLTYYFSKKKLSLIGTAIIIITGLLPYWIHNFSYILIVRSLMGIGLGLLFTITPSLAADYYPEGPLRNLTIGMQSAWAGSGGFVFNILSGYLVKIKTNYIFLAYSICILFFFFVLIFLPEKPVIQLKHNHMDKGHIRSYGLLTSILTFLFISAGMTLSLNIAIYLSDMQIGTAIEAGYATSAYSFAAFGIGCCYVFLSRFLKKYSIYFACFVSITGIFLCITTNLLFIYIGSAFIGAGLSIFMPSCVHQIIKTVPSSSISANISIMMVGSSAGQTFSGLYINFFASIISENISMRFYISAIIFLISGLLYFLYNLQQKST